MDYITKISYDQLRQMYLEKGYRFHEEKYKINLGGFRNKDIDTVDEFNDWRFLAYRDSYDNPHLVIIPQTTKPGLSYLGQTMGNVHGTGILIPGQYLDVFGLGVHGHADPHEAFVQIKMGVFKVWRDADEDGKLDLSGPVYLDVTGLNAHRAGRGDTFKVGPYSAACQVAQEDKEHEIDIAIAHRHGELYKAIYDYTLFQLS